MKYIETRPNPEQAQIIRNYWTFELEAGDLAADEAFLDHYFPPSGSCTLVVIDNPQYQNIQFLGPQTQFGKVPVYRGTRYHGINFKIAIAQELFDFDIQDLRNQRIDMKTDFENYALFEDLEKGFQNYLDTRKEKIHIDSRILEAVYQIEKQHGNLKLDAIVSSMDISLRQLQRIFKKKCGLSLKEYSKITQLRSVLYQILIENKSLHDVIYDFGYFDQSHYLKDLLRLSKINSNRLQTYLKQINYSFTSS